MISASFEDELLEEDAQGNSPTAAGAKGLRRRWGRTHFLAILAAGAVLWAVFAWAVMPRLISSAYDGHGVSFLVKALEHKSNYSVDHYLNKWNKLAAALLAGWLVAGGVVLLTTSRWFARHVAGVATPGTLGAMRMLVCLILAWVTFWMRLVETSTLPTA